MQTKSGEDRRQFRRVQAPVLCRPSGILSRIAQQQKPLDISLGGMRIFASEELQRGTRLDLELFLPDGRSVTCKAEVVWIERLPPTAPSPWDVGLRFVDVAAADRERLRVVLEEAGDSEDAEARR